MCLTNKWGRGSEEAAEISLIPFYVQKPEDEQIFHEQ